MTNSQALQEAKKRWGKSSKIERMALKKTYARQSKKAKNIDIEYRVGMIQVRPVWGSVFVVKGIGQTWEDAFKDADRKKPAE